MESKLLLCLALILSGAFTGCPTKDHRSDDPPIPIATISEMPSDTGLSEAVGVMMRTLEVDYPPSMELTVTRRIYHNGILDTVNSAREVYGTTLPTGTQYLSLGWFNPDAVNEKPQNKIKIFGSVGPYWIHIPPGPDIGGSIDVPKTGAVGVGEEQQVMEMHYGDVLAMGSVATGFPTNVAVRVTLSVVIKPLSDEERGQLRKYPNFTEAFKIDE